MTSLSLSQNKVARNFGDERKTTKWQLRKTKLGRQLRYHKRTTAVLVTKLASTTAAATAVTIVGWPVVAAVIALIAATALMMLWILYSPEQTRHLIGIIFALRSKGGITEPAEGAPRVPRCTR